MISRTGPALTLSETLTVDRRRLAPPQCSGLSSLQVPAGG